MFNKDKRRKNRDILTPEESRKTLGDNLSFAAAEAYKLLRTNLDFSLPGVEGCKIIGVTSALKGEGKSTSAVNIAYTMAQTGKNVLLLEMDMRLPTLAKRLRSKQSLVFPICWLVSAAATIFCRSPVCCPICG